MEVMKNEKILSVLLLAAVLIFVSGQEKVLAQDVYVGTSNATGWNCYVMTETINKTTYVTHSREKYKIYFTLKMVTPFQSVKYLDYTLSEGFTSRVWYFSNAQGYEGTIDQYKTPIEYNAFKAICQHLGW